jgi:glycosyltransferase involved in cell wall biosynthesis
VTGLIVHEWAEAAGGAERVVEELLASFPDAQLQVLWNDAPERFPGARETWLARTPLRRHKALAMPFLPATWRSVTAAGDVDWILVSSHLFAHHVKVRALPSSIPKLVYVHTPARYIWAPELDRRGDHALVRAVAGLLKPVDRRRAREAARMAANSAFTRQRVRDAWGVDAEVIFPPVDVERIRDGGDWRSRLTASETARLDALPREFILGASRFVPYKGLDRVIRVGEAARIPVVIAGRGPQEAALRALAREVDTPVDFVIDPSDAMLFALYQRCASYVFPAVEDFGIMPVEALAAGAPVLVPTTGGAAETAAYSGAARVADFGDIPGAARELRTLLDSGRRPRFDEVEGFSVDRFRREIREFVLRPAPSGRG